MNKLNLFITTLLCGVFCVNFYAYSKPSVAEVDSLVTKLEVAEPEERVGLLVEIAAAYLELDSRKSYNFAQQALDGAIAEGDRLNEGKAQILMGNSLFNRGKYDASLPLFRQSLAISKELNDRRLITSSLNALAIYYNQVGAQQAALDAYDEALSFLVTPEDDVSIAIIKTNVGGILCKRGDFAKAMDYFLTSLAIFEKVGDKGQIAMVKNNLAVNYHNWGNLDKALIYYQQALDLYRELNRLASQAIPLNNIGEIYKDRKLYEEAIEYYRQCYGIGIMLANLQFESIGMLGLSETYLAMGNMEEAEEKLSKAEEIFVEMNYVEGLANVNFVRGKMALVKEDLPAAKQFFEKSLAEAEKLQLIEVLKNSYEELSRLAALTDDYRSAYELFTKYSNVSDSVFNERKAKMLTEIQTRYEVEKKQAEIEILTRDNAIKDLELTRKKSRYNLMLGIILALIVFSGLLVSLYSTKRKANQLLEASNEKIIVQKDELEKLNLTKDKLLSIIGHDLRGSIGASKSMLHQLIKEPDVFPPEEQEQIKEELYHLSESTYELLENLLSWAKSQRGLKIFRDTNSAKRLVDSTIDQHLFFAHKKRITLSSQLVEDCLVDCDRNMINLVLRNLVSNAIKFTPENGKITIYGHRTGSYYRISIKDNGVGIPTENISRIFDNREFFTTYGTNSEKGSGLGLILCKEFVESNGGEISVESDLGRGTTFSFTLACAQGAGNLKGGGSVPQYAENDLVNNS